MIRRRRTGTSFSSSVSSKLFILTFLSVVVVFFVIALFGYQRLFSPIRQNNEKQLQSSVVQIENYIKTVMNSLQSQLLFLANPVLYDNKDESVYSQLIDNIMTYHQDQLQSIYLIENGKVRYSSPYGYQFFISPETINGIRQHTSKTGFWWSPPHNVSQRSVITVAKQVDRARFVVMDLNLDALTGPQTIQNEQQRIYLFTDEGEYISTNTYLAYPKTFQDHLEMKEALQALAKSSGTSYNNVQTSFGHYAVLSSNQNRWNWTVFSVIEQSQAFPLLESLKRQLIFVLLAAILLAIIVSVWIASYIRKPVTVITRQFKAAARGELEARIKLRRNDEFTFIADGFNRMMGNIQSLFEDLRASEEKKRHHELKVLQSQIHPHFLNNTLNAIYCLGEAGRPGQMGEMLRFLMGLLQYSTDKVGDVVTVEDELGQLENYVHLMNLRYGDVFEMDIAIPERFYNTPIPKLTMITLVENAIFYGLSKKGVNHIIVSGKGSGDDRVELEVSDTGPGIDPVKLSAMMTEEETPNPHKGLNNLGLRNVHERLRMTFGPAYGLHFHNEPEEGLTVTIHLPSEKVWAHESGRRGGA